MSLTGLTRLFPFSKTLSSLADQMDRSARSGKQNIVEGLPR
ncbi:MAG: four helix bundle protein [Candidatus Moranbacteria bacterium]|nr:four helix bundle protein [Candidatus Moranbacteria bacterium]